MRNAISNLAAFSAISCQRDRGALPDYWLRRGSYTFEAVTVRAAGFLKLEHGGNWLAVPGLVCNPSYAEQTIKTTLLANTIQLSVCTKNGICHGGKPFIRHIRTCGRPR